MYFNYCDECNNIFSARIPRKLCSDTCRAKKRSRIARNNPTFGGNKSRNIIKYKDKSETIHLLDSSWEVAILDETNVKWIRPKGPIWYNDINKKRRKYFPDFYIPKFCLYIDTKNPWRLKEDANKLERVCQQNDISLLIISDKKSITSNCLKQYSLGLHII